MEREVLCFCGMSMQDGFTTERKEPSMKFPVTLLANNPSIYQQSKFLILPPIPLPPTDL